MRKQKKAQQQAAAAKKAKASAKKAKAQGSGLGTQYPSWWNMSLFSGISDYAKPVVVPLSLSTSPGKDVVFNFNKTCSDRQVIKVEGIQNRMLYGDYWAARCKLIKLLGQNKLNTRKVWHGTKKIDVMKTVYTQGFMKVFNSAAAYGMGTYFARDAKYSAGGYAAKDKNNVYQMFQCEIITGESHQGSGSYKLTSWPKKSNGLIYDSLVDNTGNPSIFVLHENARAYPMFIIHFK